jgi:large subunit ribosomal protein L6
MSRIGKKPISIHPGVEVAIKGKEITVKGPKGELSYKFRPEIKVEKKENEILIFPAGENQDQAGGYKEIKAFWGLTRALIANMVKGVTEGYEKKLEIVGVGYRAKTEGEKIILEVGFSHPVEIAVPRGIKVSVEKNIISISGFDKGLVGQLAAKIRSIKKPEPYKGKGIRYEGEIVRKKAGKKAVTTGG